MESAAAAQQQQQQQPRKPIWERSASWREESQAKVKRLEEMLKESAVAECTFAPRINPVQPSRMPAAAFYVRADIYERLSRTNTKSQVEREKAVHEDLQRIEVAHREKLGVKAPEAEAGGGAGGSGGGGLPEMSEEESRRLQDFLRRQEAAARKKGERLEELVQATAPSGQPSLCDKSLRIVKEKAGEASFLQRLQTSFYDKHHEVRCRGGRGQVLQCW